MQLCLNTFLPLESISKREANGLTTNVIHQSDHSIGNAKRGGHL